MVRSLAARTFQPRSPPTTPEKPLLDAPKSPTSTTSKESRGLSWKVRYRTFLWFFSQMSKLYRLVLFCIDVKFCKKIFVGKLLTRSTRFTCFCTAQTSTFQKKSSNFFAFFGKLLHNLKFVVLNFEFLSLIFAQILIKICRNFAYVLENVEN